MSTTSIEWTNATWNPVVGCSIVSPGCHNCYAMRMAARLEAMGQEKYAGTTKKASGRTLWSGTVRLDYDALTLPLKWRKPKRIFVNSMSDLFHESIPLDFVDQVFGVMALAQQHTFQVLTKRADRMQEYMASRSKKASYWKDAARTVGYSLEWEGISLVRFPLPNVWLGVSVEDQQRTDRVEYLLKTPAAVRFVSAEPLLGPVDFGLRNWSHIDRDDCRLDWIIVGGESGPNARFCNVEWIRSIVADCKAAGVPVFVKQLGSHVIAANDHIGDWFDLCGYLDQEPTERFQGAIGRIRGFQDRKGGEPLEWPHDLRIRQMPRYEGATP